MILNSHSIGEGPHLIILHGLFGSWENWGSLMRRLSDTYCVTGLDLRNHGASEHADSMSYTDMAADVSDTLAHLQFERYALLGHSLGGKVAMTLANQVSAKNNPSGLAPDKIMIVDIAPRDYPPHHLGILDAMQKLDTKALKNRSEADKLLASEIPESAIRQFILKNLERESSGGFRWRLNLPTITQAYDQLLGMPNSASLNKASFDAPMLVIRGMQSDYVGQSELALFDAHFPQYQLVSINDAGHWPHASHPREVESALREFLAH